jgi:hypothetical protein
MDARWVKAQSAAMTDAAKVHLFTDRGTLCGGPSRARWQTIESTVTCPACRAMIGLEPLQVEPPGRVPSPRVRMVMSTGVLRGPGPKKVLLS